MAKPPKMSKGDEAKRLRPEDLAFLGEAARKQIEAALSQTDTTTSIKDIQEVLVVNSEKKTIKRASAKQISEAADKQSENQNDTKSTDSLLKRLAKAAGLPTAAGLKKNFSLETLFPGYFALKKIIYGDQKKESKKESGKNIANRDATPQNSAELVESNTKLLASMGDEQKKTNDLLNELLMTIKKMQGNNTGSGPGPQIGSGSGGGPARQRSGRMGTGARVATAAGVSAGAGSAIALITQPSGSAPGNQAFGNQASGNQAPGGSAPGNQAFGNQAFGNQASGNQAPGGQASDNLVMPINAPVSSPFGNRTRGNHLGIDFAARIGTPVVSAMNGTVEQATSSPSYGNMITIQDANGLQTLYAHLSQINVQKGQQIRAGSIIGLVGNTGLSTGPHLHFEVIENGTRKDPAPFLTGERVRPQNEQVAGESPRADGAEVAAATSAEPPGAPPDGAEVAGGPVATPISSVASSGRAQGDGAPAPGASTGAGSMDNWMANVMGGGDPYTPEVTSAPSTVPAAIRISSTTPSAGASLARASMGENAARTAPPIVNAVMDYSPQDGPNPGALGSPQRPIDQHDPGPVEPEDAGERYAKLFAEAA